MNLTHYQTEFEKIMNREYFSKEVHPIRKDAFSKFLDTGFPTQKWEDWRFTNLSAITKKNFKISDVQDAPKEKLDLSEFEMDDVADIIFYNGHFQRNISTIPKGIQLLTGLEYLETKNWQFNHPANSPFDLLNTAFMDSGLSLVISPNTVIEKPIRILFISSGKENLMVSPIVYFDLGKSASATFIEHHLGDAQAFFQNSSTHIALSQNAHLDHIRIQSNSQEFINMANLNIEQGVDSQYSFFQFAEGGKLSRLNIRADLKGEGANCNLSGLALSTNSQHLDHHIITDHKVAHCTSSQNFKSVLQDSSKGVFVGKTIVRENAQKTDSTQNNKNLLLSNNTLMNSNPQLEIYADDVKCVHGSTTGALDDNALFYLRSRGLDLMESKALLVNGFANELLDKIKQESVRAFITNQFENWLRKNTTG
tara:strand:- start:16045 stop:17313 length:1269 start_codon:yes stop_codon:yes gene_type:complete